MPNFRIGVMDKSMNTTKALGVLNLKPKNIYSLIEAEKFDEVNLSAKVLAPLHTDNITMWVPRVLNLSVDFVLKNIFEFGTMLHFYFAQLMALFETALHDATKEWRLRRLGFLRAGEGSVSDDHLLEIHEAYQYLFVKFVDDVAKNTGKNMLEEIFFL